MTVVLQRFEAGNHAILDSYSDVQVGWIRRDKHGRWWIESEEIEPIGPFRRLRDADARLRERDLQETLASPGNPGW